MKRSKFITLLSTVMAFCAIAFCFTAFSPMFAKANTNSKFQIYSKGIALTDDVNAGLSVTYNITQDERDQTYGTCYAAFGFKLSETIDASLNGDYDGLLVQMANYSDEDIKFVNYLISEDKVGRPSSQTDATYKTFIDDLGANLAESEKGVKWQGSYYYLTKKTVGTYNLDFADIKSGRSNLNNLSEVVFGLRMDEKTVKDKGFTIGSIAAYKQDDNADGGYSIKMLYDATQMTVSTTTTDTTADINLADAKLGKSAYMKAVANNTNAFITENADTVNAWALNYLNVSVKQYSVTVNTESEDGIILKNPETISIYAGRDYSVTTPTIAGFEYVSADKALTGKITGDFELTLKYRATGTVNSFDLTVKMVDGQNNAIKQDAVYKFLSGVSYSINPPEIRGYTYKNAVGNLTGEITSNTVVSLVYDKIETKWDVTEVEWGVSQSEDSLYIKGSLFGGVQFMNINQMVLINDDASTHGKTILGLSKFNFSRAIDAVNGEFDGLLIRIENLSEKDLKFSAYLLNGEKIARNFITADARYEKFVSETGAPINEWEQGIQVANAYYTFSAGASGTWNYQFSDLQTGKADMTAVDSFIIGLRQNDTAYCGKGIVISSIAGYKYDESYENGYYVETLFNAKDLTVSNQEGDETADINLVDTDLGRIVNTKVWNTNNTNNFVAEEYRENLHEITLYNTSYEQRGYVVKINCFDSEGDLLKTEIRNYKANAEYTILPPSITNFVFSESDVELTGTVTQDMEINLYYNLAKYTITVKFQDDNGNVIREDWVEKVEAGEYLVCDPTSNDEFAVEGYTYKSANTRVKFTVVRDTTIILTFTKSKGCSSSISVGLISGVCLMMASAVVVIKNLKKKSSND